MHLKEKFPKNVSFYLKTDKDVLFKFIFLEEELAKKAGILTVKEQKDYIKAKNYDIIKDKIQFRYFNEDFLRKADELIKEEKQKKEFLELIDSIRWGNKKYYTQEQLKINNNFIYSLFTAKEPKLKIKINFAIFFEKTPRKIPYQTYIQKLIFLDICKEKDSPEKKISKSISEFERTYFSKNNDLEFDKMIYLGEMKGKIFYDKKDPDNPNKVKEYYYTFPYELKKKNDIFKIIKIFDKEYLQGFDPSIWELKFPINNVLNIINGLDKFNYNAFFDKDVLDFHPSKMETKLINMNNNFILSGRPGTGKTVVILIKIIMNFLRCAYEHSNIMKGKIDFNFINEIILRKIFNNEGYEINNYEDESEEKHIDKTNIGNNNNIINNIIPTQLKENIENDDNSQEEGEIDDYSNNSENTITSTTEDGLSSEGGIYKIIFTSLSQSLCAFAENSFIRGLKRSSNINCEIYPTSQKNYEKMSSFVHQQKYPLFLNFRKLIFMIDGSLNFQFFDRPNKNKLRKRQDDCDIRFYPDCQYDVMVDLSFMVYPPPNIYFYRREYLEDPLVMTEINEDTFYNNFNTQIQSNKILNNDKSHVSTYEVYSNIISIIKGSIKSYLVGAISLEDYLSTGKKVCSFDKEQKNEIYNIFIQYEKWKYKNKYFDFQDVVNYLIREVNIELVPQNRKIFDLVFIDEVQDFSINQLYLLFLISRDIKVLAGDTCQTLSKINTFRFSDLNNVLYTFASIKNIKINEPKNIEINLNFRCQANILKCAHLIYEMIKTFFSNTLDKVRMDFSTQVGGGEKPYLIPAEIKISQNKKSLYENLEIEENKSGFDYFLKGLTENNLFLDDPKSIIDISFSVNHCVICRNNKVVKELNKKYNNKIFCSTAFESKGLEYEIVILYNFFKDSLPFVREIWIYILKNINVKLTENNYLYLIKENLDFEGFPSSIKDQIYSIFNQKFNIELSSDFKNNFSLYNFCSELKELYVAITRAKSRLYIYEEDKDILRLFMQKIFNFDIISQEVFIQKIDQENKDKFKLLINQEDNYNLLNKKVKGCLKFINNSRLTKEKLLKTAYDEYNQDNEYNYKKALYLFQVLNEEIMKTKCLINLKFIEMQKLKGTENQLIKNQFISLNKEIFELIQKINYDDNKQIKGENLINLELYKEALDYFISKNNYKKCGIVLIKQKKYEEALKYFIKGKEYSFAVNCLIEIKNYQRLYDFLLEYKEEFDLEHIQYFYKITCDNFFQKYMIQIKESKTGYKNKKAKKGIIKDDKDKMEGGIIEVNCDVDNNNLVKNYFDEKYHLYGLIPNEKIKIKNAFITTSYTNKSFYNLDELEQSNNIYTLQKTREEIIYLITTFKSLLYFMSVYLQIIITKTDKNKNQELFIKESKELILNIEKKCSKENLSNEELMGIMEKLVIKKHEFKVIIIGILKNIEAKKYIYDLYEINVFKINILEHIQSDLPIVYKKVVDNNYDKDLLSNEMVKQVVQYCKYLPIKEEDIIKYLRYIFIRSYNLNALIGITPKKEIKSLLDISVLNKKVKMFEYLFKILDIDFITGKIKNELYTDSDISKNDILFYLNNYVNMLIYKFFKYFLNKNRDYTKINNILQKIKIFPQLYEILHLISKDNDKIINLSSLINDINDIDFDDIINFESNDKDLDMKKYIKLISITNKISLIYFVLCFHKIGFKFNFHNNIIENNNIFNYIIRNIAKVLDIYNNINENNFKKNKDEIIFESISVSNIDKVEKFPIHLRCEQYKSDWYYYNNFGHYFKKLEFIQQNGKIVDNYIDNKKNVVFDSNLFINHLKNFENIFIEHLLQYIDENNQLEKYIHPKYLRLLDKESLLDIFDNKSSLDEIIKNIKEFYFTGEYTLINEEMDNYIAQGKVLLDIFYNKNVFEKVINKVLSGKKSNKYFELINYILFINLIGGGIVKIDYKNLLIKYQDMFKDIKNAEDLFFNKDFSFFEAFKLILDNYNPNLNQLLIIIWLRKLYNLFFVILCDDKNNVANKLYIDKKTLDMQLNIFEIKQYLIKEKNIKYNNNDFIDKYLFILSLFIKNIKKEENNYKDILNELKLYLSEIFYSLVNLLSNITEPKIKNKIKFSLDEMKNTKNIILDNSGFLKEIVIINDQKIVKNIMYIKIEDININLITGYEEEDINENSDDNYSEDYDQIEEKLIGNKKEKRDYY